MQDKNFSKKQALSLGWECFKKSPLLLIGAVLFWAAINFMGAGISSGVYSTDISLGALFFIMLVVIKMIVKLGMIKVALDFAGEKTSRFAELFSEAGKIVVFIAASLIYGLIVVAGLLLFIVPGVILAIKFQFFTYFIVDEDKGVIESLKESSRLTKGSKWNLFLINIIVVVINFAGFLLFGVGGLVTIPVTMIAMASVYRQLRQANKNNREQEVESSKKPYSDSFDKKAVDHEEKGALEEFQNENISQNSAQEGNGEK